MNTDKVFTAFNKDEKEILIYRENSDEYIDLINKKQINKEYFDIETLKQLKETLKVLKYMPESLIIKLYNFDRNKLVNTKDILVGLKGIITDLKETKIENGWYFHGIPMHNYHYNWNLKNKEIGLYVFNKKIILDKEYEFNLYKNLYDGKVYIVYNNNFGQILEFYNTFEYVHLNNITLNDMIKEPVIEKKKVYEYANITRKEKLESEL